MLAMVCSVLTVDDNPEILDAVSEYLKALNYEVDTATCAGEALAIIRKGWVPQVLVSDIVMPGAVDGVELAKMVRESYPSTGILLMTGWSPDQDHGFPCLAKPFSLNEVHNWITSFLK